MHTCGFAGSLRKRKRGGEAEAEQEEEAVEQQRASQTESERQPASSPPDAAAATVPPHRARKPRRTREGGLPPATEGLDSMLGGRGRGKRARGRGGGSGRAPAGTGQTSRPAAAAQPALPDAYQLPPDFDGSVLPAADFSDKKAAQRTVPEAFFQRWMSLREQARTCGLASDYVLHGSASTSCQTIAEG